MIDRSKVHERKRQDTSFFFFSLSSALHGDQDGV